MASKDGEAKESGASLQTLDQSTGSSLSEDEDNFKPGNLAQTIHNLPADNIRAILEKSTSISPSLLYSKERKVISEL